MCVTIYSCPFVNAIERLKQMCWMPLCVRTCELYASRFTGEIWIHLLLRLNIFSWFTSLVISHTFWPIYLAKVTFLGEDKATPITGCGGPLWDIEAPTFSRQLKDGSELSALCSGCFLSPGWFLVHISAGSWVYPRAIVQLEGLGELKNPMTSSGIELMTLLCVA
jgi:hypothetical protein